MLKNVELKKQIESLLFSSGKMMSEQELAGLTTSSEQEVHEALEALKKEYDERDTSLMLMQSGINWKLNVREKYLGLVTKIVSDTELPFPVLETLSVIAYKAPAMQAEVIKIRGTNAYEHVGVLVEAGFVEKKKEGRSFKISLTPKFFEYFDVPSHEAVKETFKDVKVPEQKQASESLLPQKSEAFLKPEEKLGSLAVVELSPEAVKQEEEKEKHKLGDLEVVEEMGEPEPKLNIENNKPDQGFIEDIDKRIDELSQRNDELEQDESFKRRGEIEKEIEEIMRESGLKSDDKEEKEEGAEPKDEVEEKEEESGQEKKKSKLTWPDKEEKAPEEETDEGDAEEEGDEEDNEGSEEEQKEGL